MRTPRSLDIEITSRCNLRCRYCYFYDNPAVGYRDLPAQEWLRFFDELGSLGVMNVTLAGGEPFKREDMPDLLDGIVRNRMRFSVLSNGSLVDDELAALVAGTGRCDYVQVSVDGSRAETHDYCRGTGAFAGAMRGIRNLQRRGVDVTVRVTVHRGNVHDLADIAHLLLDELGLPAFSVNSAGYLGACRSNATGVVLDPSERLTAMRTLTRLAEDYGDRVSAMAGPLAEGRTWRRMEEARANQEAPFDDGGHLTGCGCSSEKIAVRADGTIIPCPMLPHVELGHINQDSLLEIWQHSRPLEQLRRRRAIRLTEFDFCLDCPYVAYCTGNCPGLAYSLTGEIDHPSPDACLRRFLEQTGTLG